MAISALASVALAAGSQFTPYYETVFGFMRVLLQQTGEQELLLRARALECVGLMNLAVGRTVCEPVLHECTASALAGLALELPELREYTYGFFGQLAELIGAEVVPVVPSLLPRLLETLEAEDTIEFESPDGNGSDGGLAAVARQLSKGVPKDGRSMGARVRTTRTRTRTTTRRTTTTTATTTAVQSSQSARRSSTKRPRRRTASVRWLATPAAPSRRTSRRASRRCSPPASTTSTPTCAPPRCDPSGISWWRPPRRRASRAGARARCSRRMPCRRRPRRTTTAR